MGIFDRITRVVRANVNNLVGNAEDPEKVLEQTVADMQEDLVQLRQAVASAIATQKRTERQANQADSTAQEWYNRAQMALNQGNEILAREALTKRKSYQETATALKSQLEQQSTIVSRLKKDMQTLEAKIGELKTKKDMYIARARSAQASQRLNEMLGGVDATSSLSAFERMEEKVLQLEAQSEAIAELGGDDLQKQFNSLEASNDIDAELAAMKAQALPGSNPSQAKLPPPTN
ncbi:PspA/IM30 family protein [Aliterella atlantica]|uniref:Phage-shock protein n=1 Tax=Aliterella atlantica CENA595 TaxID=1618023 RepID=A0A0D8ZU78_9CYAN|nr:PspA/IM30 family protein [Aliterella atlantica]KJH72275.1 phage-shock protein [Aliterella atlantica CENA595]